MEGLGLGRGRVSFHLLKQMARSNLQRSGQKKTYMASDCGKVTKVKRKRRPESNAGSQTTISNELRSSDNTERMEEFGSKIGVIWRESKGKEGEN